MRAKHPDSTSTVKKEVAVIAKWLESAEADALLDRLAQSVRNTVLSRNLPMSFINKDPYGSRSDSEMLKEIRSELTLFLLENAGRLEATVSGNRAGLPGILKQQFVSRWLSGSRNLSKDPFRYLYKRTQDVLRGEPGFFTLSVKNRSTSYSMAPENRTIPPLVEEDFKSIPFPAKSGDLESGPLKTKAGIVDLSGYFWEQVRELCGGVSIWVDVRDFVSWVSPHVPLRQSLAENDVYLEGHETAMWHTASHPDGGTYWDPHAVRSWAENFFNQVDPKKLLIFEMLHRKKMTLAEIAQKTGYSGGSGPKYVLDHVTTKLRLFLRELPWLSPDDLNEDAFSLFFETLFDLLKKEKTTP